MKLAWLCALAIGLPSHASAQAMCERESGSHVTPLVELYTSEGCNECPAADAWLSGLANATASGAATFLAFHVTYWDEIGWRDRFGLQSSDQRQELRVRVSGKQATFTPQVMIGAVTTVDWRGRKGSPRAASRNAEAILRQLQARESELALSLSAGQEGDRVDVTFSARRDVAGNEARVWLALYEDGLRSEVAAGENAGTTLHHDRVVRALAGPWRMAGTSMSQRASLDLPPGTDRSASGLVLFAESAADASALQSVQLRLADCTGRGVAPPRQRSSLARDGG